MPPAARLPYSGGHTPNVEEVALVTESEAIVTYPAVAVASLPSTASPWPALGLASLLLLCAGWLMRRHRLAVRRGLE